MLSQTLQIIKKEELCPGTYLFEFTLPKPISWFPGQFCVLQVAPKVFRSYSIVAVSGAPTIKENKPQTITFLIDIRIGGPASQFFENATLGDTVNLIGIPLGKFIIHDRPHAKGFIATGTGLAPFIPMIKTVLDQNPYHKIDLFFGMRHTQHDYAARFFTEYPPKKYPNFTIHHCISQPENIEPRRDAELQRGVAVKRTRPDMKNMRPSALPSGFHKGRVSVILQKTIHDYTQTDFYLCGNPDMVDSMKNILAENGASTNIFAEKY